MSETAHVFNRRAVRLHRDRAAATFPGADFLAREIGERLVDRLDDVKRNFPLALDLGCRSGLLAELVGGRGGIETFIQCDLSPRMAARAKPPRLAADEEYLPFLPRSLDLVVSNLGLHWVNDLPGALVQIRQALKPDGLFLAAMFGGETLKELRAALGEAEIAVEGGLSPRVAPFADIRDVGSLLQRAGFALPSLDVDTITVSYADPVKLGHDLRAMGETNAVNGRRKTFLRRATWETAMRRYREMFPQTDGRVPATFQIIYMTAWAPDPSQPKPLTPGSAEIRIADALDSQEMPPVRKPKT